MRKLALMATVGMAVWVFGPSLKVSEARAGQYVDYWCESLAGGLACHRYACLDDDYNTLVTDTYQGFSNHDGCHAGQPWYQQPQSLGDGFLDWNYSSGQGELNYCRDQANAKYGSCDYNIWCDCNSDCWIRKFSSTQGHQIGITSPCCAHWYCGC
jgi:hypothetical protein